MQKLHVFKPDIIGISANTPEIITANLLANEIKHAFNIPLVLGGPHLIALPHETFTEFPIFDYGHLGGDKAKSYLQFFVKWFSKI